MLNPGWCDENFTEKTAVRTSPDQLFSVAEKAMSIRVGVYDDFWLTLSRGDDHTLVGWNVTIILWR